MSREISIQCLGQLQRWCDENRVTTRTYYSGQKNVFSFVAEQKKLQLEMEEQMGCFADYRIKMLVTEVMVFPDGNSYYVCPRCHITMEREFMNFCDRCGQHLDWKDRKKARIVYPGQRDSLHT